MCEMVALTHSPSLTGGIFIHFTTSARPTSILKNVAFERVFQKLLYQCIENIITILYQDHLISFVK